MKVPHHLLEAGCGGTPAESAQQTSLRCQEQLTLMASRSSGTSSLGWLNVPLVLAVFTRLEAFLAATAEGLISGAWSLVSGAFFCGSTFVAGLVGETGLVGLVGEIGLAGALVVGRFVLVVRVVEAVGIEVGAAFARLEERVGAGPDIVQQERSNRQTRRVRLSLLVHTALPQPLTIHVPSSVCTQSRTRRVLSMCRYSMLRAMEWHILGWVLDNVKTQGQPRLRIHPQS